MILTFFQRAEEQTANIRALQKELSELRAVREREAHQSEKDREELKIFRDRCVKFEEEFEMRQNEVNHAVCIFVKDVEITALFSG